MDKQVMTLSSHSETVLQTASQVELEALIRGIDSTLLTQMIKNTPHLLQLFHGFRPTHLPWKQVPAKLATDAAKTIGRKIALFSLWQKTNEEFCEKIENEIKEDAIEDNIRQLLSRLKSGQEDVLLWALLIDEREPIQSALRDGVRESLLKPTSNLMLRVNYSRQGYELEEVKNQNSSLQHKLEELEKRNHALTRNLDQADKEYEELQEHLENRTNQKEHLEAQYSELKKQQEQVSQYNISLTENLDKEKQQSQSLQRNLQIIENQIAELKSSLSNSSIELQNQLNEVKKLLKIEQGQSQQLQATKNRLERDLEAAFEKRDTEREEKEILAKKVARLEHDKQVLINQLRIFSSRQKQQKIGVQREEDDSPISSSDNIKQDFPLLTIEGAWHQATEHISQHFQMTLIDSPPPSSPSSTEERWKDWMNWQYIESLLVHKVLSSSSPSQQEKLKDTIKAQKLLALRWYLLEWIKKSTNQ